jgi:hypothetical protein
MKDLLAKKAREGGPIAFLPLPEDGPLFIGWNGLLG